MPKYGLNMGGYLTIRLGTCGVHCFKRRSAEIPRIRDTSLRGHTPRYEVVCLLVTMFVLGIVILSRCKYYVLHQVHVYLCTFPNSDLEIPVSYLGLQQGVHSPVQSVYDFTNCQYPKFSEICVN